MKFSLALFLFAPLSTSLLFSETPSLQEAINARKEQNRANAPKEKLEAYQRGIDAVEETGITEKAIGLNDMAPDFSLPNHEGEVISLSEELKKGPVVLTWYRGGWCPYCNIQLAMYQQILPQIEELGAQLIAVSPELPDKSLNTAEKNHLKFQVLSDKNLKVAHQYGIVFELTDEVSQLYKHFFDMKEYNGDEAKDNELPLAATYVIGKDGKITYAFLESDYTLRAEPRDIIAALDTLAD